MILRFLLVALVALAVLAAAFALYIRLSPMDATAWDGDPEAAARTGKPNDYLVGPGGDRPSIVSDLPPAALFDRVAAAFADHPRTEVLASDAGEGRMTLVQRSRIVGFPDAVSLRVSPEGAGSRLSVWSRSRYGQSDLGVNRMRVEGWLAAAGF